MKKRFKELLGYRELMVMLVLRDIKIRYKQSLMGVIWAVLMPIIIVLAGIVVRKAIAVFSGRDMLVADIVTVSVKSLPWAFFVGALKFSTNSLLNNRNLVTKIYFPREVCPVAAVLSSLFDFLVASVALTLFLIAAGVGFSFHLVWVPLLLMIMVGLTTGLGMIFSCANLFFRDVKYIVEIILTFAIFFTPVFYEASDFRKWKNLILLNPVAPILEGFSRAIVMKANPELPWLGYSALWAIGSLWIGWVIFYRLEHKFAEYI
jgi:lipopolysaccharide transport system permease protein